MGSRALQQEPRVGIPYRGRYLEVEAAEGVDHGGETGDVESHEVIRGDAEITQRVDRRLRAVEPGQRQPAGAGVRAHHDVPGDGQHLWPVGRLVQDQDDV